MKRRVGLIVAGCVVAVILLAGVTWAVTGAVRQALALSSASAALQEQRDALSAYESAAEALDGERDEAEDALAVAADISSLAPGLASPEATTAFSAAADALASTTAEADRAGPTLEPVVLEDVGAPSLEHAAIEFREQATAYRDAVGAVAGLKDDLTGERADLAAAAHVLFESVAVVEPSLEAASWVAPVDPKLEVRRSLELVVDADFDQAGADALQDYSDAVAAMAQAHDAELATFAGPYYDQKVAALAFANSISGGVLLEFDWVPELFGFGSGYGMAAQATLEGARDGVFSSKITITENAAARWGDGGPESIIAHEVGHAITNKCWDLFEQVAGGDYEGFATAWAIGMGYTNPSNGTTAYGRPSDELIAATMSCR